MTTILYFAELIRVGGLGIEDMNPGTLILWEMGLDLPFGQPWPWSYEE